MGPSIRRPNWRNCKGWKGAAVELLLVAAVGLDAGLAGGARLLVQAPLRPQRLLGPLGLAGKDKGFRKL